MKLTPKQIDQFREIYIKHFAVELSEEEVIEKGLRLLQFVRTAYAPRDPVYSQPPNKY